MACKRTYVNKRMIDGSWNLVEGEVTTTYTDKNENVLVSSQNYIQNNSLGEGALYNGAKYEDLKIKDQKIYREYKLFLSKKEQDFNIQETTIDTIYSAPFNYYTSRKVLKLIDSAEIYNYNYTDSISADTITLDSIVIDTTQVVESIDTSMEYYYEQDTLYYQNGKIKRNTIRRRRIIRAGNYVIKDDSIEEQSNNFLVLSDTIIVDWVYNNYFYTYEDDGEDIVLENQGNYLYQNDDNDFVFLESADSTDKGINNLDQNYLETFTLEIMHRNSANIIFQSDYQLSNYDTSYVSVHERRFFKLGKGN